jgi:hypothetical protein
VLVRDRRLAQSPGSQITEDVDDIAALAVLAVYWEPDLLEEFARVKSALFMQPDMSARTISVSRD